MEKPTSRSAREERARYIRGLGILPWAYHEARFPSKLPPAREAEDLWEFDHSLRFIWNPYRERWYIAEMYRRPVGDSGFTVIERVPRCVLCLDTLNGEPGGEYMAPSMGDRRIIDALRKLRTRENPVSAYERELAEAKAREAKEDRAECDERHYATEHLCADAVKQETTKGRHTNWTGVAL